MSLIRTYGSPSIHPGSRQGRVFPDLGRETEACVLSHFSQVQLLAALWTAILQAPLSMGFSRQEYGSGLPWPPPGDLPNPGIKPASFMSSCIGREFFTTNATWGNVKSSGHWNRKGRDAGRSQGAGFYTRQQDRVKVKDEAPQGWVREDC